MKYKTAYGTALGQSYNVTKLKKTITQYAAEHTMKTNILGEVDGVEVLGIVDTEHKLDLFPAPIIIDDRDRITCYVDMRSFMSLRKGEERVTNNREYATYKAMAILATHWYLGYGGTLKNQGKLAGRIFANVIGKKLGTKYGLDPMHISQIEGIASFYYDGLFKDNIGNRMNKLESIMKFSFNTSSTAESIVDKVKPMDNIHDLVDVILDVCETPRLHNLKAGVLITEMSRVTYGHNAAELIMMGMQYPPIWTVLVYNSITDMSFKRSYLAIVAQIIGKNSAKEFIHYVEDIITA